MFASSSRILGYNPDDLLETCGCSGKYSHRIPLLLSRIDALAISTAFAQATTASRCEILRSMLSIRATCSANITINRSYLSSRSGSFISKFRLTYPGRLRRISLVWPRLLRLSCHTIRGSACCRQLASIVIIVHPIERPCLSGEVWQRFVYLHSLEFQ